MSIYKLASALKHLPGKHPQKTHGHGGGGPSSQVSSKPASNVSSAAITTNSKFGVTSRGIALSAKLLYSDYLSKIPQKRKPEYNSHVRTYLNGQAQRPGESKDFGSGAVKAAHSYAVEQMGLK